ncbi:two-component response regulator ARR12-like [Chenopodium quinoa]|uniref:two-component response regulator ARR12-like n=1 Tax=Chenopodium quinoa TaxID=63459 RepID=UPI000B78023D|nr:two-component response regulator ARR12-like [Chenopodium quinoa]
MNSLVENERFPMGLRVLVVDDDTTCLKLMDNLLKKCHYQVTTTNQAREALKLLKENNNKFDIVITDVEMPDINGFKLLQLVGLEMKLPVIMLSAYSDTKRVMQGVKNGACDYLVKPVRIQELQNIWQHVVRRNNKLIPPRGVAKRGEGTEVSCGDDINDDDEDEMENEDPSTQKKPRLFWSVELHQKFVDAVNQLGPDKAFPKKILDLMNVEGLTREKVASHLQKYRLYLRKVNSGMSLQPGSKLGSIGADPEDAHIGGGYGIYRSLAGNGKFPNITSIPQQAAGGMLGRFNTNDGLFSLRALSSSPVMNFGNISSFPANQNTLLSTTVQMNNKVSPATDGTSLLPLNARDLGGGHQISNIGGVGVGGGANLKARWGATIECPQNLLSTSGNTHQNQSIQNDPLQFCNGVSSKGNVVDDPKLFCGRGQSSSESLEDVLGRFLKQGSDENTTVREDFGLDPFLMQ